MHSVVNNVVHSFVRFVRDIRVSGFKRRSSEWSEVRKAFLAKNHICAVCGGSVKLEVHHKKSYITYPELELDPSNLIVLCESKSFGINCHEDIGHSGNLS